MSQLQVTGEAKIRDIQGPVVANSGVITALDGAASQYVRGDGTLADFPTSTGGGSSVSYYLNGSVNQGTFGGSTYYQMSRNAIVGTGTNFSTSSDGLIAQFITDANDPDVVSIPSGNWNVEFFMSVSASSGALASFYVEIYKYNGSTFTLLATNVATPEQLTNTTTVDAYFTSVAMPLSAMAVTDRLAVRIFANVASKTVTLYTEDNRLCQIVTTFSNGLTSLNNLTDQSQYLTTGTSGTDFNIVSSGDTHTFNLPTASATNTGKLSSTDWSTFNGKVSYTGATANVNLGIYGLISGGLISNQGLRIEGDGTSNGGNLQFKQYASVTSGTIGYTTLSANDSTSFNISFHQPSSINYKNVKLSSSLLTNDIIRTYSFPDASGTIALTSNLSSYVPYTGATANVDLGLFGLTSNALKAIGDNSTYGGVISIKQNNVIGGLIGTGYTELFGKTNRLGISFGAGSIAYISNSVLTAERTYTLPDLSGTLALLEGTQTFSGSKTFSFAPRNDGGILLKNNVTTGSSGYVSVGSNGSGITIGVHNSGTNYFHELLMPNSTSYNYTFPAATGTIALTSNLSSYVPYTGATTNVNLGAYSLTANQLVAGGAGVNNAGTFTTYDQGVATQLIASTGNLSFVPFWNATTGARINAENSAGSAYIPLSFYASNFYFHSNVNFNSTIGNGTYTYTLPSATGTLALTSQLPANPVGGTGTTNYLPKFTGASTIGDSPFYDASGSIGLNTTTPALNGFNREFTVNAGTSGTARAAINIQGSRTSSSTFGVLGFFHQTTYVAGIESSRGGDATSGILQFFTSNTTGATEKMRLDAIGNLGLGVTPSAWGSNARALEYYAGSVNGCVVGFDDGSFQFGNNIYNNGGWLYKANGAASNYFQIDGRHVWRIAPSGTAGNAISFTQAMTLASTGNLLVGTTTDAGYKLDVNGTGRFSGLTQDAIQTVVRMSGKNASNQVKALDFKLTAGTPLWTISTAADGTDVGINIMPNGSAGLSLAYSTGAATFSSSVSGTSIRSSAIGSFGFNTANNGEFQIYATAADGMIMAGRGSNHDMVITNKNGSDVFRIPTGTTTANFVGNVGIGVTPAAWAAPTAGKVIQLGNTASIFSYNNLTTDLASNIYFNGSDYLYIQTGAASLYRQQSGEHAWFTVGSGTGGTSAGITERMRITSGGNVLIGTTSDNGNRFQVIGNSSFTTGSNSVVDIFTLRNNNATSSGLRQRFQNGFGDLAAIRVSQRDNGSLADDGLMEFQVASNSSLATKLSIRNDGLVAFPQINDFTTGNSPNTWINPSSSYGIYINTSSIRYKKDIVNYDKGLDIVNQLRPVYYKGISDVDGNKQFAGFIAEEIHDLGLTEFVNYLEDGRPNSLSYPNMMTLAVKAIQEQQAQIEELKALIAAK